MNRGRKPERKTNSPKGKSHNPQKISFDEDPLTVQTNEQHAQGVTLGFVEDGKEICAAKKSQRSDIVERVEKSDRGGNQNERDH